MGKSDFERGVRHGSSGKYDPPENLVGETLDHDTYDHYHERREDYRAGREVGKEGAVDGDDD
jgi:hypothetical protein